MTVQELKALTQGETRAFRAILLLQKVTRRSGRTGSPFLAVEAGDSGGSLNFTIFSNSAPFDVFVGLEPGAVVEVDGNVDFFQGRLSPKIQVARALGADEIESGRYMETLVEMPPVPPSELWEELQDYMTGIAHEGLRETVRTALELVEERFRVVPAAIAMHHAYRHGLLEHTTRVARAAQALLPLYPEVNPSLALAGAIVHDLGKTIEYSGNDAAAKTRAGILQGHVVLGYRIARQAALKAKLDADSLERLEHVILSHQGEMEWGAAAMAATPEAVFISMVDNLDAKMGMVQRSLRHAPEGVEFSDYLPGLQTSVLLTPPAANQAPESPGTDAPDLFQEE